VLLLHIITHSAQQRRDAAILLALREVIELWAAHWNDDPKPFVWRTAEEIIEEVRRGRAALHQVHATPHH